jgi:hypothetical protein
MLGGELAVLQAPMFDLVCRLILSRSLMIAGALPK